MFCKNCGKEISNETKFCPSCGQPVSSVSAEGAAAGMEDTAASQTDTPAFAPDTAPGNTQSAYGTDQASGFGQPAYSAPDTQSDMMMPKKNGRKIAAIVAAIIVVALVAVGATAHAQITNFVKRTFSSPASYYNYVEKKNLKTGRKNLVENYKKYEDTVNGKDATKSASYKLELGSSAKTMLSMIGIDFSAFESAEISTAAQLKDNTTIGQTKILLNGNDAVTANLYLDTDTKEYYIQIPELSDAYLNLSSLLQTPSENASITTMQDIMFSIGDYLPTSEQVEALYDTYTNLVVDNLAKVEKSTDTLEAGGISQKCTVLKVTITGKEYYDIAKAILDTAKTDKTLESVLKNIDQKAEGVNSYESFQNTIDDLLDDLEADKERVSSAEGKVVMDVFVNNSGDIVGRTITLSPVNDDTFTITSHMPEDNSKFGYEMSIASSDTTYLSVSGNGTRKSGKMSGEFSVSLDESYNPSTAVIASMQDIITIKIDDLDEDKLEDGYFNGTITLQCNAIAAMSTYELEIKAASDKKQSSFAMSVLCADDNLATISLEIKDAKAPAVQKPGDGDTIYDITSDSDMEAFTNSMDLDTFLQDIQTKSGIDFSSYLNMIKGLTGGSSDSSFGSSDILDPDGGIGDDYGLGSDYGLDESFGTDGDTGLDDFNFDDYNFDDYTPEEDTTQPDSTQPDTMHHEEYHHEHHGNEL